MIMGEPMAVFSMIHPVDAYFSLVHLRRLTTELKVMLQDYASKGRNARGEPRPVAAATQERRLLGVAAPLRDVGLGTSIALPEPHEPHQTRTK